MAPLRAVGALSLFAACCHAVTINSDYFPWPLKAAAVPEVHNGDTLNVTWNSTQTQAILYHWCGGTLIETIPGLGGNGNHVFVVNSSWTSPCHWQFVNQANSENYFDSGWIDVTNVKATPAVTWVPSATGEACGIQATTVTAAATSGAAATSAVSSSPAACTAASTDVAAAHGPNLSSGASMGIGIAVGLAIAAVTAAVWIPLRRRCLRPTNPNPSQESSEAAVQRHMSQRLPEADGQARCEMDSTGKVGRSGLIELPSSPGTRFP